MKRRLSIRPRADADIDEAAAFLANQSTVLAERFLDRVGDTLELIRDRPLLWPTCAYINHPRLVGLRRRSVVAFPNHIFFYLISADGIDVIRLLHGARDITTLLGGEPGDEHGRDGD